MNDLPKEVLDELSVPYLENAERVVAVTGGGYWATMFRLRDGSLGAILRAGAPHVGTNSRMDMIRSTDGGRTWGQPSLVVPGTKDLDVRGSASGVMQDGTIVSGYVESDWYISGSFSVAKYAFTSWYVCSTDNGKTWSPKQEMKADPIFSPAMYGRIIVLDDGTALMTVFGKKCENIGKPGEPFYCGIVRSRDNGRTWGDCSIIAPECSEVSLVKVPDGRLLAMVRHSQPSAGDSVYQAESTDDGYTWGEPRPLTKPFQHPADIALLKSGNLLLTYGNRIGELAVGAVLSYDLGRTWDWEHRIILARHSLVLRGKSSSDSGYPTTMQEEDGAINTLYYRLGHDQLSKDQKEICLQYERDVFERPPASDDMRRFEEGICIRYTEEQLLEIMK